MGNITTPSSAENGRPICRLLILILIFWCGQNIYTPYITPYLLSAGMAAAAAGTVIGSYGLSQMLLRVPMGIISDTAVDHKWFITAGPLMTVLSALTFLFAKTPVWYMISRFIAGIGAATWVSYTVLFSRFYPESRSRYAMSLATGFCTGGCLLSYVISGLLYQKMGMKSLLIFSFLLGVLGVMIACTMGDTRIDTGTEIGPIKVGEALGQVLRSKNLWTAMLMAGFHNFITYAPMTAFSVSVAEQLGAGGGILAVMCGLNMGSYMLTSFLLSSPGAKMWKDHSVIIVSFVVSALYCLAVPQVRNYRVLLVVQAFSGITNGCMMSPLMSRALKDVSRVTRATAMGLFQSFHGLGLTLGPVVMGYLIDRKGIGEAYWVMAVLSALGVIWAAFSFRE